MSLDIIEPTRERMRRGDVLGTLVDQKTDRRAYKSQTPFERMILRRVIEKEWFEAGAKLERHYYGSLGVDVRMGDGPAGHSDCEYPQTYHAQKLAQAAKHLLPREFTALLSQIEESQTTETLGQNLGFRDKAQARAAGQQLINTALERLARFWGFLQSPP